MTHFAISIFLNHSILPAALIGIARYRYVLKSYRPFIVFVVVALLNETLSLLLILNGISNTVNSNLYVLAECLLLLYQFYQWHGCTAKRLSIFAVPLFLTWITDNLILHSLRDNNSLFRSVYALVLLFFSIDRMNRVIVNHNRKLLSNTVFLLCASFLFYYGSKLFVELFHLYGVRFSDEFYEDMWLCLSIINCLSNFIYAIAIVCMPTKEEFLMLY